MPEVEFRVLCANTEIACNRVKTLMNDFSSIKDAKKDHVYDHFGTRKFDSVADAIKRKNQLYTQAGNDVCDIKLIIK
ncbi:MAG TPA: hypothetical protein VGA92_03505 [Candidatus Nitrosotenuis sp.]|jgi:hypothetical protein